MLMYQGYAATQSGFFKEFLHWIVQLEVNCFAIYQHVVINLPFWSLCTGCHIYM